MRAAKRAPGVAESPRDASTSSVALSRAMSRADDGCGERPWRRRSSSAMEELGGGVGASSSSSSLTERRGGGRSDVIVSRERDGKED